MILYVSLHPKNAMEEHAELLTGVMEYLTGVSKIGVKLDILHDFEFHVLEACRPLGLGEALNPHGYRQPQVRQVDGHGGHLGVQHTYRHTTYLYNNSISAIYALFHWLYKKLTCIILLAELSPK